MSRDCRSSGPDANRRRDGAVRLLAPLAALGPLDQAGAQQHPHVEVQVAGVDAQPLRELAVRERCSPSPPSISSTRSRSGWPSALSCSARSIVRTSAASRGGGLRHRSLYIANSAYVVKLGGGRAVEQRDRLAVRRAEEARRRGRVRRARERARNRLAPSSPRPRGRPPGSPRRAPAASSSRARRRRAGRRSPGVLAPRARGRPGRAKPCGRRRRAPWSASPSVTPSSSAVVLGRGRLAAQLAADAMHLGRLLLDPVEERPA